MTPARTTSAGVFQVLTSPGPAAIAVVRLCGPGTSAFIARHLRPDRSAHVAWRAGQVRRAALLDETGAAIDDILVSVHAGEPTPDLRLHLHGNPLLVRRTCALLTTCGLTETKEAQAALWEAADTVEAEAYALLPRMQTARGAHWLIAQVGRLREAVRSLLGDGSPARVQRTCAEISARAAVVEWFVRPARVALVGPPNVGKSTLANALADREVSVVAPQPGTTRDWVEVSGQVDGYPIVWLDTAGLGSSADPLESAGMDRTRGLMRQADAIVAVLDVTTANRAAQEEFLSGSGHLNVAAVALNKGDIVSDAAELRASLPVEWRARATLVSALHRSGLQELMRVMLSGLGRDDKVLELPAASTARQLGLLKDLTHLSDRNAMRAKLLQVLHDPDPANAVPSGGLHDGLLQL